MDGYLLTFILLVFAIVSIRLTHTGKLFILKISPGRVVVKKGSPPNAFVKECKLIIRHQIVRGYIYGVKNDNGVSLRFSSSIKPDQAQRFRNVFPFDLFSSNRRPNDFDSTSPRKRARKM